MNIRFSSSLSFPWFLLFTQSENVDILSLPSVNSHSFFSVVRRLLMLLVQKMRHPSVLFLEYCFLTVTSAMKISLVGTGRVE